MNILLVLPSAPVQLICTSSTIAPAKLAGVVIVKALGLLVSTVQSPLPLLVPALNVQPLGIPLMFTVAKPTISDGSASARFIGSPATPAGRLAFWSPVPELPAESVKLPFATVTVTPPFCEPLVAVAVHTIESDVVRLDIVARDVFE